MHTRTAVLVVGAIWLLGACGGGGGGSPKTTYNLAGSYDFVLTAGDLTGNGAADCTPDVNDSGTATVTWTTGSNQCTLDIEGQSITATVTASVNGNTVKKSKSGPDADCDVSYGETWSLTWTSDNAASGYARWSCQWTDSGTVYGCSQQDDLTVTRQP